jgi:hypothetical protein
MVFGPLRPAAQGLASLDASAVAQDPKRKGSRAKRREGLKTLPYNTVAVNAPWLRWDYFVADGVAH